MFKKHSEESKKKISQALKGRKLSLEHRRKISEKLKGKSNPRFDGRTINTTGYMMVYLPGHPMAQKKPYVLEHRLIMSEHIGRPLLKTEIVHHINGNKLDNRIENLQLLPKRNGGMRLNAECPNCHFKFHLQ